MAHTTENLMARLEEACTLDGYLAELKASGKQAPATLSAYLDTLLAAQPLTRPEVIREAGLNATFGYQVFQGTRRITRNNALLLSRALGYTLTQTQRLLALANQGRLAPQDPRDAVVIWCIRHGLSCQRTDEELYRRGMGTLSPAR